MDASLSLFSVLMQVSIPTLLLQGEVENVIICSQVWLLTFIS